MDRDRKILLAGSVVVLVFIAYIALTPIIVAGARAYGVSTAEASTPYGESLGIEIGTGAETSGQASVIDFVLPASWLAYVGSETQDVYDVDGVYKSQEQVTMSYSLSVTYANVDTIKATVKIKTAYSTSNFEHTLANLKALTGTSPISDSGSVQKSITQHLTDVSCPLTGGTVTYHIYCQVTAVGATSGETLTATVSYTQFGSLVYTRTTESGSADVTPTVSVASWMDDALGLPQGSAITIVAIVAVIAAYKVVQRYR